MNVFDFVIYFLLSLRNITPLFVHSSTRKCDGFSFDSNNQQCIHYFDVGFLQTNNLVVARGVNYHALERCDTPPTVIPTVTPDGKSLSAQQPDCIAMGIHSNQLTSISMVTTSHNT